MNMSMRHRLVLLPILFIFTTLSLFSSIVTPLFEPPDEIRHYQLIRYLIDNRILPIDEFGKEETMQKMGLFDLNTSGMHRQPLYYVLGALLVANLEDPIDLPTPNPFWAYESQQASRDNKLQYLTTDATTYPYNGTTLVIHILRLWSLLLSVGTIIATWFISKTIWPNSPSKVAATLTVTALNPMFIYISGSINNDNLIALLGTICIWLSIVALKDGFSSKTTILIGLVWGCALLSKLSGLLLIVSWGIALVMSSWKARNYLLFFSRLTYITIIALVISGWWFIRHFLLYGNLFALPVMGTWTSREQLGSLWLWSDLVYTWTTLWGRFGYGQIPLPTVIYLIFTLFTTFAVLGLIKKYLIMLTIQSRSGRTSGTWLILATTILVFVIALTYYVINNPTGANGRYIFPALSAFSVLAINGMSSWSTKYKKIILVNISLLMIIIAVYSTTIWVPWTYSKPKLITEISIRDRFPNYAQLVWDDGIVLLGSMISPLEASQGEYVNLETCWRSDKARQNNYVFYAQLLDNTLNSLGQRDTHTGLGTFPTSAWKPGDIFCESYPITVNAELASPLAADIQIGFYDYGSLQQVLAYNVSGEPLDRVIIGKIKLIPTTETSIIQHENDVNLQFENFVSISGYTWSSKNIHPGDTLKLQITWKVTNPMKVSYTIFAHLLSSDGDIITQHDGIPINGSYPTNFWGTSETIVDEKSFIVPDMVSSGQTMLAVGLYDLDTGIRLARDTDSEFLDYAILPGPTITQ
jgi:hypothetical protein